MYDITLRRIVFSTDADITLKMMKARTGLTPNILCRLALTLSLDEPGNPRCVTDDPKSQREINRYTLLGEYDSGFCALVAGRLASDRVEPEQADEAFIAHIHRGISLLPNRVKSVADIGRLAHGTATPSAEASSEVADVMESRSWRRVAIRSQKAAGSR